MKIKIIALVTFCIAFMVVSAWGSVYQISDFEGTWNVNCMSNGPSSPWGERALITFAADGSFSGTTTDSTGKTEPVSGTFAISLDGLISMIGNADNFNCRMDLGKTVIVCTNQWDDGSSEMKVFTKKATSYSQADLVGNWAGHTLSDGPSSPWWLKTSITIAADGSFTGTKTDSTGLVGPSSGSFYISTDGVITIPSVPSLQCNMDSGKTMFACIGLMSDGVSIQLKILTKMAPSYTLTDLSGVWGIHDLATAGKSDTFSSYGKLTIKKDGSFTGSLHYTDTTIPDSVNGTLAISSDGIVTPTSGNSNHDMHCSMDSGKTFITCTATQSSGSSEMIVFTKLSSYPSIGTLSPAIFVSAAGVAQSFTAVYGDPDSNTDIKQVFLRVDNFVNGLYLRYDKAINKLYLYNDAGTATVGSCTPGVAGKLSNTQGALNCGLTTVSKAGNSITVKWNITPNVAFASVTPKNMYMLVRDMSNLTAGWIDKGNWTITAVNAKPTLGTVSPALVTSNTDAPMLFTVTYSDADGYANLKTVEFLAIEAATGTANGIRTRYDIVTNKLYLYDDAGATMIAGGGCIPGATGKTISNTRGILDCQGTSVSKSGNMVTVKWLITPKAVFATGINKYLKLKATDNSNAYVGFANKGTWTINP